MPFCKFTSAVFYFLCFGEIYNVHSRQEIVKVTLYYESLCPYSQEFITDQLYPGYTEIKKSLIVDLVPFGLANQTKTDGKWEFQCQHGPKECFGNKLQVCALSQRSSLDNILAFIDCLMNSTNPASPINGRICSSLNSLSWNEIRKCAESSEGSRLLAHYGDRTNSLSPKLTYVPHILFNGIFNETLEDEARSDFLKTACSLFSEKPSGCTISGSTMQLAQYWLKTGLNPTKRLHYNIFLS